MTLAVMRQADNTQALIPPPLRVRWFDNRIGALHRKDDSDRIGLLPLAPVRVELADIADESDLVTARKQVVVRELPLSLGAGDLLCREIDVDAIEAVRRHHLALGAGKDRRE